MMMELLAAVEREADARQHDVVRVVLSLAGLCELTAHEMILLHNREGKSCLVYGTESFLGRQVAPDKWELVSRLTLTHSPWPGKLYLEMSKDQSVEMFFSVKSIYF